MRKMLLAALVGAAAMVGASDSAKAAVCEYGYGCGGPAYFNLGAQDQFTWDFSGGGSLYFWLSGDPYYFYVESVDNTLSGEQFYNTVYAPGGIISYNTDSWAVTVTLYDSPCPTCSGAGIFEQGNNPPPPDPFPTTPIPGTLPLLASVLAAGFLFFWRRNRSALAAA